MVASKKFKGVIHSIPDYDTQEDITESLIYEKRRMGKMNSVIIVFEETKFSLHTYYCGTEYRCFLHKKKVEVCNACGRLGHYTDVFPNPNDGHCKGCRVKEPLENYECDLT